jgi:hypothetical protein
VSELARGNKLAVVALCVFGRVLSRAIDDPMLAKDLRDAVRVQAITASDLHRPMCDQDLALLTTAQEIK